MLVIVIIYLKKTQLKENLGITMFLGQVYIVGAIDISEQYPSLGTCVKTS